MIGLISQKPLLTSLLTGDLFLVERNSGNFGVYFYTISGQGGGGGNVAGQGFISGGISGYVAKWISSTGLSTGLIYESPSGIGVGIANNEYYFHVTGQGKFDNVAFNIGTTPNLNNIVTVDFNNSAYQNYNLSGNSIIRGTGYAPGRNLTARIMCDTGNRNLTWSASWTWMGENPPLNILSGRWAILSLISFDSSETGVAASCITSA